MFTNKPRILHVWDLPEKLVRVKLKKEIREDLFKKLLKSRTIKSLSKELKCKFSFKISQEPIRMYKTGDLFIPLWFLNRSLNLIRYNKNILEKNVIEFRGLRGTSIKEPNFPWKEDERIIRTISHLIADGCGGSPVGKTGKPNYTNTNIELVKEFESDLSFFGAVPYYTSSKIRTEKHRKEIYRVTFPKIISYILSDTYSINFLSEKARLPSKIYKLSKPLIYQFIRAFGDDEGSVKGTQINFYSANKDLLNDIIKLIRERLNEIKTTTDIRINNIKKDGRICYYFAIKAQDLENYLKHISFTHPLKRRKLNHQLSCRKKDKNTGWNYRTKQLILNSLKEKDKISYEIAENTLINHRTVNKHINGYSDNGKYFKGLVELDLVKNISKSHKGLFSITSKGKYFKFF